MSEQEVEKLMDLSFSDRFKNVAVLIVASVIHNREKAKAIILN